MSVSGLLTVLTEYVADAVALVKYPDGSDRPPPEHVYRYWGDAGRPQWEKSEAGIVVGNIEEEFVSTQFPNAARARVGRGGPTPATGYLVTPIALRYWKCWSPATAINGSIFTNQPQWDKDTAVLAEIMDNVARALFRLECAPGQPVTDPEMLTFLADVSCGGFTLTEVVPINPRGERAGVLWRCHVLVRSSSGPPS
jgi:hypothetical protein